MVTYGQKSIIISGRNPPVELGYILYHTCSLHRNNSGCGKREAHKKLSMGFYLKRQHLLLELP